MMGVAASGVTKAPASSWSFIVCSYVKIIEVIFRMICFWKKTVKTKIRPFPAGIGFKDLRVLCVGAALSEVPA